MTVEAIPTGRENAVKLQPGNDSRALRIAINQANKNGDVIINTGNGYFRPDFTDDGDIAEYEHYVASELHRAREILYKRLKMKESAIALMNKD